MLSIGQRTGACLPVRERKVEGPCALRWLRGGSRRSRPWPTPPWSTPRLTFSSSRPMFPTPSSPGAQSRRPSLTSPSREQRQREHRVGDWRRKHRGRLGWRRGEHQTRRRGWRRDGKAPPLDGLRLRAPLRGGGESDEWSRARRLPSILSRGDLSPSHSDASAQGDRIGFAAP
jgi:hypothetical protein